MYEFEENPISTAEHYDLDDAGSDRENQEKENNGEFPKVPTEPDKDGVKVAPKKRIVRKPRVMLNTAKLKGDRGLHTIQDYFHDVKFKGKGHEVEDLTTIMRKLEHWGHRVFPNMLFQDFVNRVEQLCRKNDVQTHMKKYKAGILPMEGRIDDQREERLEDEPVDEFDALLSEQVEIQRNVSHRDNAGQASISSYMDFSFRDDFGADLSLGVAEIPPTPPPPSAILTEEAKTKIAENRKAALERLRAKQASQAPEMSQTMEE